MPTPVYGQTWWGEQWLNALTQIDFDNRLPRGRTYTNRGSVSGLEVRHGDITAMVQGSRPYPYRVTIKVPPLSPADTRRLIDTVAGDPTIIARMLNRQLDPAVLDHAGRLKIKVFPGSWKDLGMHCSCPDWAVPCKHLAAVIYLMSREIDGNPFLVFSLRGLDLGDELKARGIAIQREAAAELPAATTFLPTVSARIAAAHKGSVDTLAALDFSTIPALADPLIQVLPAKPAFFGSGDFRQIYEAALKHIGREAGRALLLLNAPEIEAPVVAFKSRYRLPARVIAKPKFRADDQPRIEIDAAYEARLEGLSTIEGWPTLLDALRRTDAAALPDLQPQVTAFHQVNLACLHLLAQGAVVPQLFDAGDGAVGLRWLPAALDEAVRGLLATLAEKLPSGLVAQRSAKLLKPLSAEVQAQVLCSLFLERMIRHWHGPLIERLVGNKVVALFFGSGRARFDGPGEGSLAAGIQVWLSRFHLSRQDLAPLLKLEESGKGLTLALSLEVESRSAPLTAPVPLAKVLTEKRWEKPRYPLLQTVSLLAEFFPPLQAYVRTGAAQPMRLQAEALPQFLFDTLPVIRLLGIRALLPKALDRVLRPRLSMQISAKTQRGAAHFNAGDVFGFDWRIALGDHVLTAADFEKLVRSTSGVIRFKSEYVYLDPGEIAQLRAQLAKPPAPSGTDLLRIALAGEYAGSPVRMDAATQRIVTELTAIGDIRLPPELQASLRPYQLRGYAWLYRNARAGFGSVIADDMGLGKTVQVIAALLKLKSDGALDRAKALVVVPTTLLTNWQKEIARFAPSLSSGIFHGSTRSVGDKDLPDVLLTTYGVVRSDAAALRKIEWRIVIIDEAQNIKNPAAAQTKAVKSIPAPSFVAMSGTPVENRLSEYWSIMDFANRGYLGNLAQFGREYGAPIQTHHDQQALQRFHRITAPFLLRRLKSDKSIISDLPDKIEQDQYCELTKAQTAIYESVVREGLKVIAGTSDTFQRQGLVLQMILALKQICNHPAQYLKQGSDDPALSGKALLFLGLIESIRENHDKVLVFTQFREMGTLLAGWVRARHGREPLFLHGGVTRPKRDEMVERFQNDRTEQVFILSLKAGGTGLNLTAASNVIHYDLWWNPAVEAQATDRAYRIGQQRNVQVHRFITRASFEERINDMIRSKRALANLAVGVGEKWIGNLNNTELRELFSLGAPVDVKPSGRTQNRSR